MRERTLVLAAVQTPLPLALVHTLILGSGAAGLAAAVRLAEAGVKDVLIVTEGLSMGTSINTGSDKQTYYKLSLAGAEADSPALLAQTYFDGGAMHGDLALVEAALSARAFLRLVDLGVPFPRDEFGQFAGYRTDHDPRRRATSIGPHTSREMCRVLARRVEELGVPVRENRVAVDLLTAEEGGERRAIGAVLVDRRGQLEVVGAENVVFATGGPGGLYKNSVYPVVHAGGIGLALRAGAAAANLGESQFGLASIGFRWNVSGTFMQVVPRVTSTEADGRSGPREFLRGYFDSAAAMHSAVFLKGYQWPFDAEKVIGGSSLIDLLVHVETELAGRRVFLDFRQDSEGFRLEDLAEEAREYLVRSGATGPTPLARLAAMNPAAIQLFAEHGIDLARQPLEIAVSAQHNNGGLAGNVWWESTNLAHLFPVGEVNGSHGIRRPGGAALNAGQVGALRAAEFIAARYAGWTTAEEAIERAARSSVAAIHDWLNRSQRATTDWREVRGELQSRMSLAGALVRSKDVLGEAVEAAWSQVDRLERDGCRWTGEAETAEALRSRDLALTQAVYLDAVRFAVASGVGSRGSSVVLDPVGPPVHPAMGDRWRIAPENASFRAQVQETRLLGPRKLEHRWVPRRPIPQGDLWFETVWARFRDGAIYDR